ncbi:MAG: DUF6090 family protein [Eudoraea sp.]|uniref:DUF6090 family protein n=1 Tax=Eudoraea sp. TaxID=1979955 RepID=UPI0032636CCB
MIKFFRKIRQKLLTENKFSKYLFYAIGEILLVVVGILIALQVNNWNERKKDRKSEYKSYQKILSSLQKDSLELVKIIRIQDLSLESQNMFMTTDHSILLGSLGANEIDHHLLQFRNGVLSFFPRYGTYKTLLSTSGMDNIKSEKIKSLLIDLYDYKYKRYENIDAVIDQKFEFGVVPMLSRDLGFMGFQDVIKKSVDLEKFEENYSELVLSCEMNYITNMAGKNILHDIQKSVNELIDVIDKQLKKE